MNKRILMICYYYPPLADVGCKRSVAFSIYFKKYGWEPYVLSVKNPDKAYCSLGHEQPPSGINVKYSYSVINPYKFFSLAHGVAIRILRLFKVELKRNYFYDIFCIPDIFLGWIPHAIIAGLNTIKKYNPDTIYVSCSPWSSAIIGVALKLLTKKKLIIDFRDPYAIEIKSRKKELYPFGLRKKIDQRIEDLILKNADIVILNTEETRKLYVEQYPYIKDKAFTVHNGFDSTYLPSDNKCSKYEKFTIIYTGEFYFYALESKVFFKAVKRLKRDGQLNKYNFQFLFYGDNSKEIKRLSRKYAIEDLVDSRERIPYNDLLINLKRSHLQLLRIVKPAISTKLYEGITLNVPFLATIPSGEVQEIINRYSPNSYIISDESIDKVYDAILDAKKKYASNKIVKNNVTEFLDHFSRENLTKKFLKIVDKNETSKYLKKK